MKTNALAERFIEVPPTHNLGTNDAASLPFVWAGDVSPSAALAEIVEGVLTANAFSMVYGESNSGKTYLVLHLAICIARQLPWLGCRTEPGAVIYIAAEGGRTIENRVLAYQRHTNAGPFPLGIVKASVDLLHPKADTERLIELILARSKEIGKPVTLVIVDTLARVMAGGNENDSSDMGAVVSNCDYIRERTGAHLLIVHHSGKDVARGARGHSSLRASLDTEIEVTHDAVSGARIAKVTKQRDLSSNGAEYVGTLRPLEIGTNQWGNPITACVVEDIDANPVVKRKRAIPRAAIVALESLQQAISEIGERAMSDRVPSGARTATLEQWRTRYQLRVPLDANADAPDAERQKATETRKKAFQRERKLLQDAQIIDCWADRWFIQS